MFLLSRQKPDESVDLQWTTGWSCQRKIPEVVRRIERAQKKDERNKASRDFISFSGSWTQRANFLSCLQEKSDLKCPQIICLRRSDKNIELGCWSIEGKTFQQYRSECFSYCVWRPFEAITAAKRLCCWSVLHISLDFGPFLRQNSLNSEPICELNHRIQNSSVIQAPMQQNQPQTIILPPPCLKDGIRLFGQTSGYSVIQAFSCFSYSSLAALWLSLILNV